MFEGKDQKGLDESTRPAKSVDQYTQVNCSPSSLFADDLFPHQSKLLGEREVLQANSAVVSACSCSMLLACSRSAFAQTLWTCAIRPHAIFGPREPHLMPKLAQTGKEVQTSPAVLQATSLIRHLCNLAAAEKVSVHHRRRLECGRFHLRHQRRLRALARCRQSARGCSHLRKCVLARLVLFHANSDPIP